MLYARYSSPMDLVGRYIKQGRFGKFVQDFIEGEYERKKHEAERDQEMMLWIGYVHSYSKETFNDWKKLVMKPANTSRRSSDATMTEKDVQSIMDGLFKSKPQE